MSNKPSLVEHPDKIVPALPQKIPITYLWFGKDVPEDYLISLAELNYPVVFLKNPHISKNFTRQILDIQKSDYYRLQHLYDYGGIYSDFDNVIDYECLMELLEPYRHQDKLVFMTNLKHNRAALKEMTNNLIFAPYAGMPILKKMLDSVNEEKEKIWGFAGMRFVAKFSQPLEVNMDKCVTHTGDWSWVDASNDVLKRKSKPHNKYSQKLVKKRDILAKNQQLQSQLTRLKSSSNKASTKLSQVKEQNQMLKQQLDLAKTQVSKEVIEQLKVQDEHKRIGENGWERGKDQVLMQNQVEYLRGRSDKLEAEKDVMLVVSAGAVVIVLMLVLIGVMLMRKRKAVSFNPIVETSRNISEER